MASTHDAARNRMLDEVKDGAGAACEGGDASSQIVLIRGCDPVMAERAKGFLPKLIGNAQIESATEDDGARPRAASLPFLPRTSVLRVLSRAYDGAGLPAYVWASAVFISALQGRKYDVVVFAPGACRWNKAQKPIPGGYDKPVDPVSVRVRRRRRPGGGGGVGGGAPEGRRALGRPKRPENRRAGNSALGALYTLRAQRRFRKMLSWERFLAVWRPGGPPGATPENGDASSRG